jgi:NAD(P)-dependent dehydrogenase (short-subunit alcohol dehydrogenase family)
MQTLIVGAGNLGTNIAYSLLKRGESVIVTTRNHEKGKKLEEQLSAFGRVNYLIADPGTDFGVADMFRKAEEIAGKIDNLIVTVGGYAVDSIRKPVHFGEMLESHLEIPLNILKNFENYAKDNASAVFISSIQSIYTSSWAAVSYLLGKSSLNKLVEIAAAQLLERNIRVNAVAPSSIENVFMPGRDWRSTRKLGRLLTPPEDIAEVVAFLCSPAGEWINGVVIPLDGGNRFTHASD